MAYKILEIEDDSDCATCTARHTGELEFLALVKIKCLGLVPCHECGRMYQAIAAESATRWDRTYGE